MSNRFSPEELRRAANALITVLTEGDRDEWAYIRKEAVGQYAAPSGDPWRYATSGQKLNGWAIADELSQLLGVDRKQCELAAAEVYAKQRHRAVYDALIAYTAELTRNIGRAKR